MKKKIMATLIIFAMIATIGATVYAINENNTNIDNYAESKTDTTDLPESQAYSNSQQSMSSEEINPSSIQTEAEDIIPDTKQADCKPNSDPDENTIKGEYICSSEYFRDEAFVRAPEYVTTITFNENEHCMFHIYYIGGLFDAEGTYQIEGNTIKVALDLRGTGFDDITYMDDKYVFEIIDNDHIVLGATQDPVHGGSCYAARVGDSFIRK